MVVVGLDDTEVRVLVDTNWLSSQPSGSNLRLIEVDGDGRRDGDPGRIPGSTVLNHRASLQDHQSLDVIAREAFEDLMTRCGIGNDTTVVLYGARDTCQAAYVFWVFKLYGHRDCRLLDGGLAKWRRERRPEAGNTEQLPQETYRAPPADLTIRAFRDQVLAQIYGGWPLVDAREPREFAGHASEPGGAQAGPPAQRGGHIPAAVNVPWMLALNPNGTFKPEADLRALYAARGITPDLPVITYSHTGERGAHAWFVLSQLLGYPDVRNYDGSWAEWGNLIRAPIERTPGQSRPAER